MEPLGEKLKTAREQKGYTFDQIARDTNITRKYLEALENEDFSQFPGEPYLLGFLRNYAEYLGLDVQELISAYRTIKIQEQPVPVEQLLKKSPPSPFLIGGIAGGAALLLIAVLVFSFSGQRSGGAVKAVVQRKVQQYSLESGFLEKRLYSGDSVLVSVGAQKYKLSIAALGEALTLAGPSGNAKFELGQEGAVDLNADGVSDLRVFVADLFKNEPAKGVSLRLELLQTGAASASASAGTKPAVAQTSAAEKPPLETAPIPVSSNAPGPVIFASGSPYPFTLQATFKGYCMFRWEPDRKDREERYFHKAEVLNIQAQNGIRLWLSNASSVKLVAIGGGKTVDIELGGSGEVVVSDVKWVKDDDGRFKLTTVRLD
ncbi:MAG: helix-turn-helix domain-containing protein [Treponemataceae bacterium]